MHSRHLILKEIPSGTPFRSYCGENPFENGPSMNRILAEVLQTGVLFLQVRAKFSIRKNQMRSSKVSWYIDAIRSFPVRGPCFSVAGDWKPYELWLAWFALRSTVEKVTSGNWMRINLAQKSVSLHQLLQFHMHWHDDIGARVELPIVLWSKSWATSLEHDIIVVKADGYWIQEVQMRIAQRLFNSVFMHLGPPFMWRSFMFSSDTLPGRLLWPSAPFLKDLNNIPQLCFSYGSLTFKLFLVENPNPGRANIYRLVRVSRVSECLWASPTISGRNRSTTRVQLLMELESPEM